MTPLVNAGCASESSFVASPVLSDDWGSESGYNGDYRFSGEWGVRRSTVVLSAVALALTLVAIAAYVIKPDRGQPDADSDELATTVSKAVTYFDFGHYDRAAETFRSAAEEGMNDAAAWYQYARSVELDEGIDLDLYMTAYGLLLRQGGSEEYLCATEELLVGYAIPFDYDSAIAGEYLSGDLVMLIGTVAGVEWGRVQSGRDSVRVDTKPNEWTGHLGETVVVDMPRHRRYQIGDRIRVIGWFDQICPAIDHSGGTTVSPCISAAGARIVAP